MKRIAFLVLLALALLLTSCSLTVGDGTANTTTTPSQTQIPTDNHDYEATVTPPTCEDEGYTTYHCAHCDDSYIAEKVPALGHTEETVAGRDATCTAEGVIDGVVCSVCDKVLSAQTVIPAKGHTYESVVTAPTCQDAGYTTYTCSVCSDSYTANPVAAAGHNWKDATVEAPKTCQTCGKTEGNALPGPLPDDGGNTSGGFDKTLYVNYIDVGQGDSIFIKVGDCDILIDGGKSGSASTVVNYLKGKDVDDIELMINSHPDNDHYGGLPTVLNNFKVEELWISPFAKTTSTYTSFKSTASSKGLTPVTPDVGTVYTYENLKLTVIANGSGASNSNDSSIVVKIEYGNFSFLFTGDISSTVENKLVGKDIQCDVLKVAHHGSAGSSSSAFLNATGAKYGVISVGAGNSYGHPTSAALNRLSSAGISVYRTDQDGHVVFSCDGENLYLPGDDGVVGGGEVVTPPSGGDSGSGEVVTPPSGGDSGSGEVVTPPSGGDSGDGGSDETEENTQLFIGNINTKKLHLPTCSYLPNESNRKYGYDYWEFMEAGYEHCSRCMKYYTP